MKFISVDHVLLILDHQLFNLKMLLREAEYEKNKALIESIKSQIAFTEKKISNLHNLGIEVA